MKFVKVIFATILLIAIMAVPVLAQEVTEPTKVYSEAAFVADEAKLQNEFHNSEIWRSENYVKYLDGVIFNLEETARVKKEVVTNYKYLSQYNSYFMTLIPNATNDYENAVAWVDAFKEYKKAVQADLRVRYNY